MAKLRLICGLLAWFLVRPPSYAAEPNETFATRTILSSGVLLVTDELSAPNNYPDTYLGIRSLEGQIGRVDDDGSVYGNGFASGLQSVNMEINTIRFAVTGFGDPTFPGAHSVSGQFEVFVDVEDINGQPIDSFSELRALGTGVVQEFLYTDLSWSGKVYNVNIENRRPPNDIDYFTFSGLVPGAYFAARTANPTVPALDTFLGWFDESGALVGSNDDYGSGALSRILGMVPASGKLTFAVTGFGDFDFGGLHTQSSGYQLQIVQTIDAVPGDYNGDLEVNAADYTVWRNHSHQSFLLNGENPDALTPGFVDDEDYLFWKSHYGESLGGETATGTAAAVPEPAAITISLLAFGCLFARRTMRLPSTAVPFTRPTNLRSIPLKSGR